MLYLAAMKKIISAAALLACVGALALPLTASAQTAPNATMSTAPKPMQSPGSSHHTRHRGVFFRALHKLTLTDAQKTQINGYIDASDQAGKGATREQRRTNEKKLEAQILLVLTPTQQQQLQTEISAEKQTRHDKMMMKMQASPMPMSSHSAGGM